MVHLESEGLKELSELTILRFLQVPNPTSVKWNELST